MTFVEEIQFNENLRILGEHIWEALLADKRINRLPERTKQKIIDIACLYRRIENFWQILPDHRRLMIVYEKRAVMWIYLMQKGFCNERGVDEKDIDYLSLAVSIYDVVQPRFQHLWIDWKGDVDDNFTSGCDQLEDAV